MAIQIINERAFIELYKENASDLKWIMQCAFSRQRSRLLPTVGDSRPLLLTSHLLIIPRHYELTWLFVLSLDLSPLKSSYQKAVDANDVVGRFFLSAALVLGRRSWVACDWLCYLPWKVPSWVMVHNVRSGLYVTAILHLFLAPRTHKTQSYLFLQSFVSAVDGSR